MVLPPKTLRTIALNLGGRPSSRRCSGKPSRSPRSRGPSLRLSRSGRRADHRDCQPAINATDDRCGADRPPSRNCCSLAPAKSAASYAAHARANARACSVGKDRSAAVTTSRVCLPPSSFANASSHCFSYEEAQRAGIAQANGDARAHNGRKPSYARKRFKSVGEDRERREVVGLAMSLMVQMKGHTPLI